MKKKLLTLILLVFSISAVNFNAAAENAAAAVPSPRKAGGFDRARPNKFTQTMQVLGRYLLLYIPNRLVDASDIFTLDLSVGGGFAAELQATRYFQAGGSYGESYFLAKGYARQYGAGHQETNHYGLFFMEKDITFVDEVSGTVREYVIDFPQFSVADYHLDAFRDDDVDFWKAGGRLGWIVCFGFGIHPIEIADFITGFLGLDLMKDDF
ncbi:MAG: hypothetical protein PHH77_08985 [Victivallaceae bacterium]|nr:hypothetical protein [Victivallaceae bacterium]